MYQIVHQNITHTHVTGQLVLKPKDGRILLMSFDHRDQRWWETRCDRCTSQSDVVNPPKSIYNVDCNGWFLKYKVFRGSDASRYRPSGN